MLLILIPQVAGVFSALLGIVINAKFPKFEFENEVQVVKQSLSTLLSMLAATLYGLLNLGIAIVFSVLLGNPLLGMLLMLLLGVMLCAILVVLIHGPLKKKYNSYSL